MHRLIVILVLAGCTAAPSGGFRDSTVTIASAAAFDPVRFAGRWYEIARYPTTFEAGCSDTKTDYRARPNGSLMVVSTCERGGVQRRIEGIAEVTGHGRMTVRFDDVREPATYWVLWVAEDYRTAVVGVPSGAGGWILHRGRGIPRDRLDAARQVLDFNGFDLSRLEMTPHLRG